MSDPLVAPAEVALQQPTNPKPDFAKVLSDDVLRRQLSRDAAYFGLRYRRITRDADLVMGLDPVIYLVDNDVIRNLIDLNPEDPENQRRAMRVFDNPDFKYAIPIGAFYELLNWIEKLVPDHKVRQADVSITENRRDALKYLAAALDVSPDNPNEYLLIKEISSAVARLTEITSELLKFLSSENFLGAYSEFDDSVRESLQRLIESGKRHDDNTPRSDKDKYDAQNLAVVCMRNSFSKHSHFLDSFVLLTQTGIVLGLPKTIYNSGDRDFVDELANSFETSSTRQRYPVLTPERAFFVEELRLSGRLRKETVDKFVRNQQAFTAFASIFRDSDVAFRELSPERQRAILDRVDQLIDELADLANDPLYAILDKDRSNKSPRVNASIELQIRTLVDPSQREIISAKNTVFDSSKSLFRNVAQLSERLYKLSPTIYTAERAPHSSGTFERLIIKSNYPEDPIIIRGELYLDDESTAGTPLGYSFRWRTACPEKLFFEALESIFSITTDRWKKGFISALEVCALTKDEDGPPEALLVFTNAGVYVASLQQSLRLALQGGTRITEELKKAIFIIESEFNRRIDIQAIRVQTVFGEFQLDVVNDEEGIREVFVISRFNIGEQIAHLCKSTGTIPTITPRLNIALQEITGRFERYSIRVSKQIDVSTTRVAV